MATFRVADEDGDFLRRAIESEPYPTAEAYATACRERDQARAERDGHRARQIEAERALILLLIREGGRTVFTPREMISAPSGGSFVSSRDVRTGNEVLAFVAAGSDRVEEDD
jgi:hypothetical protein